MPMRVWTSLNQRCHYIAYPIDDEEEEGGDNLFDPEAGRASDDPFAHLKLEDTPDTAVSDEEVSKYVGGTEEE